MLEQLRSLARYNRWMNDKLYAACAKLEDAERKRDAGAFFGSIHATLNHLLLGDRVWLSRMTGDAQRYASLDEAGEEIPLRALDQVLCESFERLRTERAQTDADLLEWVAALSAESLDECSRGRLEPAGHPRLRGVSRELRVSRHLALRSSL